MLEHGGQLRRAARRYGIALERWLDLSTGVNPTSWRGIDVPLSTWARLPEDEDDLVEVARNYYGAQNVLPIAGSQAAILNLPRLRVPGRVGVLAQCYAEHPLRWREAGHQVTPLSVRDCTAAADALDVLVLVNPNNPTGQRFARADLLDWHARLAIRGGWLIIDEAFADAEPQDSLVSYTDREGLIVLRSLGKFFGLAGARVGFVLGAPSILYPLGERVGPWTVAGPARFVAQRALADERWHTTMRERLLVDSERLSTLLQRCDLPPDGGCSLFQWVPTARAASLYDALAQRGILTRLFETPCSLRFGLPADEGAWHRLEAALLECQHRQP